MKREGIEEKTTHRTGVVDAGEEGCRFVVLCVDGLNQCCFKEPKRYYYGKGRRDNPAHMQWLGFGLLL